MALAGNIASARVDIVRPSARIIKFLLLTPDTSAWTRGRLQPEMMERLSEKRLWQGARMWEKQMPVPTISSGLYRRCCFTQASL
tara:strand:- start:9385 stop:9636 length:252 start_codon:yes stop_codon:yes gene_type:complete